MMMKSWLYGLVLLLSLTSVFAETILTVKVPVADMFHDPSLNSKVISQVIYGSTVDLLSKSNGWMFIKTNDEYKGWVLGQNLSLKNADPKLKIAKVKSLFANIYQTPDVDAKPPLFTLSFDASLSVVKIANEQWVQIQLIGGGTAWVQQGDVVVDPELLTMREMLDLTKQFIGLPYRWGGISSFGFDCSGFVQTMYKQMGVILPRDAASQAKWSHFTTVAKNDLQPGDLLYFGWNNKIDHTGIYLGNNQFINSTHRMEPQVQISDFNDPYWRDLFISAKRLKEGFDSDYKGTIVEIPKNAEAEIKKYSWHEGCPVGVEDLAYVKLNYWGFDDKVHTGVLVVNKNIAPEVVDIFAEIFKAKFPIQKMQPISAYKGNDDASMNDNNTSAFNCRMQTDFKDRFSIHSFGGAIDINPLINPYIKGSKIIPEAGKKYVDRNVKHLGKITIDSDVYKVFAKYGWVWGGSWQKDIKDYQHFEKPLTKK